METVLSLPPADIPPHWSRKYSPRAWAYLENGNNYRAIYRNSGIEGYWLIQNSEEVSDLVSEANSKGDVTSIKAYDFSTLYTNLPHNE